MHIHILGICGTFMGGIALIARELGNKVTGADQNVYPPMSTQLESQGIQLAQYSPENLIPKPDLVIIGNALSRGNPEVEAVLNQNIPYTSGPQWLAECVLQNRWILAIAGTHGKTTTTSMLAWILEVAGKAPGFLVGGVPLNFGYSARLGQSPFFVIEADEYDTAFFDKRSKFVHYRPRTAVLNNLEFDHGDIFPDLKAIQTQFHHLVRTVPGNGLIIAPYNHQNLEEVFAMGCWTPIEHTAISDSSCQWHAELLEPDGSLFNIYQNNNLLGEIRWGLTGRHNVANALSAFAAATHARLSPEIIVDALCQFQNVRRRMELLAVVNGISVYDDFAHHPTAIESTLEGLRAQVGTQRIIAVLEPRSNTMRMGYHTDRLPQSLAHADVTIIFTPLDFKWSASLVSQRGPNFKIFQSMNTLADELIHLVRPGDHLVFMSNGGFGGIHQRFISGIRSRFSSE